jgi:hypothetical protein
MSRGYDFIHLYSNTVILNKVKDPYPNASPFLKGG